MANAKRKKGGGRVTAKKSAEPPRRPSRRPRGPDRIGPFDRPDANRPMGQVGRRPSSPAKLFAFAVVYFVSGVAAFFVLSGSLRIIVGVVLIGLSLLWLRGASAATVRRQQQRGRRTG